MKGLQKQVKAALNRGQDPKEKVLRNYSFTGNPGTGKTVVARAFGEVFKGLGLLSDGKVAECKANELIAGYVGQTAPLVKAKMDEARGGVLFIDEAYGLDPGPGGAYNFKKEALETLLGNLTDPQYQNKMIVILAGYTKDIANLLASNPGLPSRFTKQIEFHEWPPESCLRLLL